LVAQISLDTLKHRLKDQRFAAPPFQPLGSRHSQAWNWFAVECSQESLADRARCVHSIGWVPTRLIEFHSKGWFRKDARIHCENLLRKSQKLLSNGKRNPDVWIIKAIQQSSTKRYELIRLTAKVKSTGKLGALSPSAFQKVR